MKKNRFIAVLVTAALLLGLTACNADPSKDTMTSADGSETASDSVATESESNKSASGNKEDLVCIIDVADESFNTDIMNMIREKFGDKYNLIIKTWAGTDEIQTIKTASIAGEQVDLCMYWPNSMPDFLESDLALPLDEYMTDEWKSRFSEGALEIGTYGNSLYNLPYSTVYPMVIVNKSIADEAGIELRGDGKWTWDEFLVFCSQVSDNTEAFGSVIPNGWAPWLTRNAYMQIWDTDEELNAFCNGDISFLSDEIKEASDLVVHSFNENCFYPGGEASLALETDEAYAALASGKVASLFTVNSMVLSVLVDTGLDDYVIMDWPSMGTNPTDPVLGGSNGYFIPSCAKNVEGAVEVLDFLTGPECAAVRAQAGCVSTVIVNDVMNVDTELMSQISRCSDQIHSEITALSSELTTYLELMPANYYHYGEEALQELEDMRLEAIE